MKQRVPRFKPSKSRLAATDLESQARRALKELGTRPVKSLGQNFLVDETALAKILTAAELEISDVVVEVGPGLGVVTEQLSTRVARVMAIELDRVLAANLAERLRPAGNVEIVNGDVLNFDPSQALPDIRYKLLANLPYYITSLALRHFLESEHKPSRMVLMVQKEVAQRIVAPPGKLSVLGISVQLYGAPSIVSVVPASSFFPRPKVDSAIVKVDIYDKPAVDVDIEKLFRLVHAGFSHARKQLHNAISRSIWLPAGGAIEALHDAGIEESARAQMLSLDQWASLVRSFERLGYL